MCSRQAKELGNKLLAILSQLHNNAILISNLSSFGVWDSREDNVCLRTRPTWDKTGFNANLCIKLINGVRSQTCTCTTQSKAHLSVLKIKLDHFLSVI